MVVAALVAGDRWHRGIQAHNEGAVASSGGSVGDREDNQ